MKHPTLLHLSLSMAALLFAAVLVRPTGARAEEATHEIQKSATPAAVGVPSKVALTVQGKNGWHVNADAPITVSAKAEPGLDLPKPKLARADLAQSTKESARFEIPFTASAPGKKTITAEARFVMCQEQACKPVRETVALEIDVGEATAAAAPPVSPSSKKTTRATKAKKTATQ